LTNTISYSLLKYTHSKLLGEELNVGILFVFPEQNQVEFIYPHSISRIKKAYPNVSVDLIKSYLSSFKKKAEQLGKHLDQYVFNYNELITDQFLITDGSSLQFTPFNYALTIGDIEKTKNYYYNLYLSYYESPVSQLIARKTDKFIVSEVKKLILNKRPNIEKLLLTDKYIISNKKVSFRPDLRWQNGTLNLIKGVSFDFKEEEDITDKALLVQNQLNYLGEEIQKNNARVDLLLSKPSNPQFQDAYHYALSILNNANAPKEVIEESGIEEYANDVASDIEA
jgi:hypothetical protein